MTSVYFISDGEYIKIGMANDVKDRIKVLQTGNPRKLKVLKTIDFPDSKSARKYETELHCHYRSFNSHGEWFRMNDELCQCCGIVSEEMMVEEQNSKIKRNEELLAWLKEQIADAKKKQMQLHDIVMEEHRQLRLAQEEHLKVLSETLRLKEANKKQNGKVKPKNEIRHLWDYLSYGTQAWGVT